MGDLEGGFTMIRREGDQPFAGSGKAAENGHHLLRRFAGRDDLRKPDAAPRIFDAFTKLHHGQESPTYEVFLPGFRKVLQQAVCFRGERAADAAEFSQCIGWRGSRSEPFPNAIQGKLQQRQRTFSSDSLPSEKFDRAPFERVGYAGALGRTSCRK